ncbi:hypothetical protein SUGI_0651690 [Cryptomeria japonica]|nr:hypothetical protein SUGI_0651690 [Cryptomeria japonica]
MKLQPLKSLDGRKAIKSEIEDVRAIESFDRYYYIRKREEEMNSGSECWLENELDGEIEMNEKSEELEEIFKKKENSEVTIEERMEKKEESLACDL